MDKKHITISDGCVTIREADSKEIIGIIINDLEDGHKTKIFNCSPMDIDDIAKFISGRSLVANNLNNHYESKTPNANDPE